MTAIVTVLRFFSYSSIFNDTISFEILAIARACHLCSSKPELKCKSITFVSDSKTAVSWINSSGVGSWDHSHLILEIRTFWEV